MAAHSDASWRTMLSCVRAALHGEPAPELSPAERPAVMRCARAHGTLGLIVDPGRPWGAAIRKKLAMRALKFLAELKAASEALDAAGIPWLSLKGPWLAEHAYGTQDRRRMVDIDLLVPHGRLTDALDALTDAGFSPRWETGQEGIADVDKHLPPLTRTEGLPVELHWSLDYPDSPLRIDHAALFDRARTETLQGVALRVPEPEDQFLYLCTHATVNHVGGVRMKSYVDIALMLRAFGDGFDRAALLERATAWRARRAVCLALAVCARLFEDATCAEWRDAFDAHDLDEEIVANTLAELRAFAEIGGAASEGMTHAFSGGALNRVAALARALFPSRAVLAKWYPVSARSPHAFLYYPVRWKDLLKRHGARAWRVIRRDTAALDRIERGRNAQRLRDWLANESDEESNDSGA